MKLRELNRNIKIRMVTDFFSDLSEMSIIPFMAIYFSSKLGVALTGLLLLVNIALTIFSGFLSGHLSDRYGRKGVMVTAVLLQVLAFLMMGVANSPWYESVWMTFWMFVVLGIASGIMSPAAQAMIVDVSTREERPLIYSFMYWSGNIAISIGAILGGLFFPDHRFVLFLAFMCISVINAILIGFFIKETHHEEEVNETCPKKKTMVHNYLEILKDKRFMVFNLATILVITLEFQLDKYIAVRLQHDIHQFFFGFHIDGVKMLSIIIFINTALVTLIGLKVSGWSKKMDHMRMLSIGLFIYSVGYAILATSHIILVLMVAAFLMTIGELLYIPIRQTYQADLIKDDLRSSYLAVDGFSYHLARVFGSLGLSLGAIVPSGLMGTIFFLIGISGLICFRYALRGVASKEGTTEGSMELENIS